MTTSEFKHRTRFWNLRSHSEMNAMLWHLTSSEVELGVGVMREV